MTTVTSRNRSVRASAGVSSHSPHARGWQHDGAEVAAVAGRLTGLGTADTHPAQCTQAAHMAAASLVSTGLCGRRVVQVSSALPAVGRRVPRAVVPWVCAQATWGVRGDLSETAARAIPRFLCEVFSKLVFGAGVR